jgi:phage terminase large subunit
MEIVFDANGNEKQIEAFKCWLDPTVTDIVYGGSKGSGKSYLGCSLIGGDALIYAGTHYFVARKKLNDLRKFTIPSFHEAFENLGVSQSFFKYNAQDSVFNFYNGSKIFFLEAKHLPSDPTYARFGSMQMTRGWIEEAGEFEEDAKNNLFASVGRWKNDKYNLVGKLLQTCNPAKNYLYKKFYKPYKADELEPYKRFIQALPTDNKMLSKGYLDHLGRILNENQKQRLLYGNWEYDDDPTKLCGYDEIISILSNNHIQPSKSDAKYLTADVARFGSDRAIIAVWHGWILIDFVIFDKSKTTEIAQTINSLRVKHSIPANRCIADEDGVGGGVVDQCGIVGFVNNSQPIKEQTIIGLEKPNYYNLQAQCGYYLAKKINAFEVFVAAEIGDKNSEEIIEELEELKSSKSDDENRLRLLPKADIKQNIGRSPDWRDVLLMRSYFDLKPPSKAVRAYL